MTPTLWLLFALVVLIVGIAGFFIGRQSSPDKGRMQELEKEMTDYRQEVGKSFEKTAALLTTMATTYRELYTHLADNYEKLAGSPAEKLLPVQPDMLPPAAPADEPATTAPAAAATGITAAVEEDSGMNEEAHEETAPATEETLESEEPPRPPLDYPATETEPESVPDSPERKDEAQSKP